MQHILAGVIETYDPRLVVLSALACLLACVVGLSLISRARSRRMAGETERLRQYVRELETRKRELEATAASLTGTLDQAAASGRAKSQFLATMSHELRTPLNAVIGFAELLKDELFGPLGDERYRDYAGDIHASARHLLELINDILDYARIDAARLVLDEKELEVPELVDGVLRMIGAKAAEAGLTLSEEHQPGLRLRGDRRRIKQVLLNLLSNAIKFTQEGGNVTVTARRSGPEIAISVIDTGIGIAAVDIPRALEPFGQIDNGLDRSYEGTGLGLPLCKQLMELHGGTLHIDSAVGRGTTVTVSFPAGRVIANEVAEMVPRPAAPPLRAQLRPLAAD